MVTLLKIDVDEPLVVPDWAVQDDILDLLDDGGGQVLSFEETSVATTTDIVPAPKTTNTTAKGKLCPTRSLTTRAMLLIRASLVKSSPSTSSLHGRSAG